MFILSQAWRSSVSMFRRSSSTVTSPFFDSSTQQGIHAPQCVSCFGRYDRGRGQSALTTSNAGEMKQAHGIIGRGYQGCGLALGAFGGGYSSGSWLKQGAVLPD